MGGGRKEKKKRRKRNTFKSKFSLNLEFKKKKKKNDTRKAINRITLAMLIDFFALTNLAQRSHLYILFPSKISTTYVEYRLFKMESQFVINYILMLGKKKKM